MVILIQDDKVDITNITKEEWQVMRGVFLLMYNSIERVMSRSKEDRMAATKIMLNDNEPFSEIDFDDEGIANEFAEEYNLLQEIISKTK